MDGNTDQYFLTVKEIHNQKQNKTRILESDVKKIQKNSTILHSYCFNTIHWQL